jgi:hypothetical protein
VRERQVCTAHAEVCVYTCNLQPLQSQEFCLKNISAFWMPIMVKHKNYNSFYQTNILHIQIHIHDISPLLNISAGNCHFWGTTSIFNLVNFNEIFSSKICNNIIKSVLLQHTGIKKQKYVLIMVHLILIQYYMFHSALSSYNIKYTTNITHFCISILSYFNKAAILS